MELKIETLRLLLELTRRGKLVWKMGQYDDWWDATLGDEKLHVEFISFMRTDETGSDRTMARIKYVFLDDHCIGTEGFQLICEMLPLCSPGWLEARERGEARRVQAIEQLKQMLNS